MRSLEWAQVWRLRLDRHHLLKPAPRRRLADVAGDVCGVQAQVMASAEVALGIRVAGVTRADVADELWERRGLVKTHGIRSTLHLFPARELPLWMAALRENRPPKRRVGPGGLPSTERERKRTQAIVEAIGEALDGRCLTRAELGREIAARAGPWAEEKVVPSFSEMGPRWLASLGAAAAAGVLCYGPSRGNRVTFARPDQWIGRWEEVDGRRALVEVFRRWLGAYGPANTRDFAQWFNTDQGLADDLARSLGKDVSEVDVDGWRALALTADVARPRRLTGANVHLLPQFDSYVIGCHPRDQLVPPELRAHLDEDRVSAPWARRRLPACSATGPAG
ncbi:MAG TPA: crosslink repair DNA glycosylase YcaQ family protein, partial [Candidatus Dormibacteraeota bacterium]